ncbi:hypothetical protein Poli38472_004416 [Pythium oligandrum]|uniref:Peroxisome membrane anchor protein Pex14p N-terminal domain-containing protein n=1 Tax=Pythium oligandrum TaxID=41045 RepID=A0A8K1CA23_PYTOL|nr:hypothetical protein Poli38472_004416 [Pythium oligandrum]|eukprot:TMW59347.1 hypothetical protein Poli38472_004416 [Pythium oligandrum]
MASDAAFLAKCEQFLLHPTVRALSLAQRVDFLEKKGLSPAEITSVLKNVERQNGLSPLLRTPLPSAATASTAAGAIVQKKPLPWWALVVRYGSAAAATLVLAYAYVRFREHMMSKMLQAQRDEQARRRQKRNATVVDLLAVISQQRKQYDEVVKRVQSRVSRLQTLKATALNEEKQKTSVVTDARQLELQALQTQVLELKSAVTTTFSSPPESPPHSLSSATSTQSIEKSNDLSTANSARNSQPSRPAYSLPVVPSSFTATRSPLESTDEETIQERVSGRSHLALTN